MTETSVLEIFPSLDAASERKVLEDQLVEGNDEDEDVWEEDSAFPGILVKEGRRVRYIREITCHFSASITETDIPESKQCFTW